MFNKCIFIVSLFSSAIVFAQAVDPTKPLNLHAQSSAESVRQAGELTLESVIQADNEVRVVINGQILKVGDQINQYKVQNIKDKLVTLTSPEDTLTLSLFRNQVIKATTKDTQL